MRTKINLCITIAFFFFQTALANIYYVSTTGNDTYGDGSSGSPWRTLRHAVSKVPANQGHTILIAAGTFIEGGQVRIPLGVNIEGAGRNVTIIKAASSFYYNPSSPGYATDKYLISLDAASPVDGNQSLRNFTVDGDSKQLHGGIYVRYRNHITIDGVSVQYTNFNGIWLWDVKDSEIRNTDLFNCSWGSTGYCVGALNLGNVERVEIDQLSVDESIGYGIKAIGPSGSNNLFELKIHDSRVSVHPYGLWNNGGAPNIAIELWSVNMVGCEIYNSYVDNTISLVNSNSPPATGIQTVRVHHNTLDMETRAKGAGYGVELSVHDAEIDHNYFIKGKYGIAHWDNFVQNWSIHHNVFYGLGGGYPGDMVRSQRTGLHNVNFYNNTIEFIGDKTMNVIGIYGGTSENVNLLNNLFINNNTGYSYYPNSLVHLENGAVLNTLSVKNNLFDRLSIGSVAGTYSGNLTGDPKITKTGARPNPYYVPAAGSPLIDAGLTLVSAVLDPIVGSAPDIGAFEYTTGIANETPQVSITSPANNSGFAAGSSIAITANASDPDGTISKVEFFNGSTRLGEDLTSPYSFTWTNAPAGSHSLTSKAIDNAGATATSPAVLVTVTNGPLPSPWRNSDIGSVSATGSASYNNATFTLSGSGADIWDVADEFQFVYQSLSSNGSIVAKVNSLTNTHGWAKAGVMIRESLNANAAHATSVITPSYGVSFQSRSATGDISSHTTLAGHTAPKWLKIERRENTLTSSYSSDGITWTVIGTGVIPMGTNVYVGLCATSHVDGMLTAASFSDVGVSFVNADPVVTITAPTNNAGLVSGTSATITANASDSDGTISKVEFFQGSTLLGTDTSSPYTFNWTNIAAGSYSLTSKATDNAGGTATSPVVSVTVINGPLPSPWRNSDIGAVGAAGSASYSNAAFTLWGSGTDIWDIADEFQFVYQSLSGNGAIVARVNSLDNTHGWAKAGVMIRESLNENSTHVTSVITPSYGVSYQTRSGTGDISYHTTLAGHTAPKWLKVERQENTFTSSYSSDGITWTVIGTGVIAMGPNAYIGLCVTSHEDGVIAGASFSDVNVAFVNADPTVTITSPTNNATLISGTSVTVMADASDSDGAISKVEFFQESTLLGTDTSSPYTFDWTNIAEGSYVLTSKATDNAGGTATSPAVSVTVINGALPSPWQNSDIGAVGAAGSASYNNGSFTVRGSGTDIWDTADELQFVYQTLSGNGAIVAKVNSLTNTHGWAKAGVMIRESLNANAAHATSVVTPSYGVSFQSRSATGNISSHTTLAGHAAPKWLKIERQENTFTSSYSSDGITWTVIGTGTITMGPDVYIGLCVTSHAGGVITTASFSDVMLTGPLPSPWQNSDIGIVGAAGSASYNNGSFTVRGSGADIWHIADGFQFVYQSLSGDGAIVAKVNSLANTNGWAKAGVMIRESLTADSKHATSVVTPSYGVSFQRRTIAGDISYHTTLAGHSAPVWLKIERSGNTFTSSHSSDGVGWTVIGTDVITMVANVYIGLCVTSHADGVTSAASINDVSVSGGTALVKGDISSGRTAQPNAPLLQEEETSQRLEVFPNPVKDKLQIICTSATAQSAQITIKSVTSLAAKRMVVPLHAGLNRIQVNVDDAHAGLYVVSIVTLDGKRLVTKILVAK